jgi:DNA polymerase
MRWTERQRAMLREMGVRLWLPDDAEAVVQAEPAPAAVAPAPAEARSERRSSASPRAPAQGPAPASASRAATATGASAADDAPRLPGLAPADWLVVGEPLDAADARQQQLLENMLRAIGVGLVAPDRERRAVYCALRGTAPDGGSPDAEVLASALATVAPRCVLAFSRAAAAALLGADVPLGGLRGRVHAHGGVPVVVTFPLVYLLRHPAEKAKAGPICASRCAHSRRPRDAAMLVLVIDRRCA